MNVAECCAAGLAPLQIPAKKTVSAPDNTGYEGFVKVPKFLQKEKFKNRYSFNVCLVIFEFVNLPRGAFPALATIAQKSEISVSTVKRAMAELKTKDIIIVIRRKGHTNLYKLSPRIEEQINRKKDSTALAAPDSCNGAVVALPLDAVLYSDEENIIKEQLRKIYDEYPRKTEPFEKIFPEMYDAAKWVQEEQHISLPDAVVFLGEKVHSYKWHTDYWGENQKRYIIGIQKFFHEKYFMEEENMWWRN